MKPKKSETTRKRFRRPHIIIALAVVAVAAIACSIFFLVSNSSNRSQLESDLSRLGRDFYESYYYGQVEAAFDADKLKEHLAKYETTGIKVSLDNLSRYPSESLDPKSIVAEFKNSKTDAPCDTTETKVTIYPTSPYTQGDYRIETTLACGFED